MILLNPFHKSFLGVSWIPVQTFLCSNVLYVGDWIKDFSVSIFRCVISVKAAESYLYMWFSGVDFA